MNEILTDIYVFVYWFIGATIYMIAIDLLIIHLLRELGRKLYK